MCFNYQHSLCAVCAPLIGADSLTVNIPGQYVGYIKSHGHEGPFVAKLPIAVLVKIHQFCLRK